MKKNRALGGFTLTELMFTVLIIAILAGVSMPFFGRMLETQRINTARDSLRSVYAGQRVHAGMNGGNFWAWNNNSTMAEWRNNLHMDDPNPDDGSVVYTIVVNNAAGNQTFTATATRVGGSNNGETLTINHNRVEGGNWTP